MAVVEALLASGATVAATTHYAELKTFAQDHPMVSNASVAFDVKTLRPTYRLEIGLPGKSQAFAIAERLGLPPEILADARSRLAAEHVTMEETLAAIARAREERERELAEAETERAAASRERERARSGVGRARQEAAAILGDARRAADELLARAEREVAEVRRELVRQRNLARGRSAAERSAAAESFDRLASRTTEARKATQRAAPASEGEAGKPDAATAEETVQPRVGLHGRSRTLGSVGRIIEVSGRTGRVTLQTDDARVVIPADDVEIVPEPIRGPAPRDLEAEDLRRRAASRISPQLDLRGERVEAALEQLAQYLDEALLAGLDQAIIVHGAGTGALRRSIREFLAEHPRVRSTRSGRREEGGDGATVAEL
jgi:DNA mismatch repair protein MutS2